MQVGIVHAVLAIAYTGVGLTLALVARYDKLVPPASSAFVAILWLGFILAISFTEAWIKFRAPFVPRHLALDIGRTVFAGLNAVESGLCLGLWLVYGISASADEDRLGLLIALTVVFIAQVVYIHPKLYLRGDFAIYEELKRAPEDLSSHQMMVFSEMQDTVTNNAQPPAFFHIIYVLGEVAKVVLLVLYSVHFLRQLSGTA